MRQPLHYLVAAALAVALPAGAAEPQHMWTVEHFDEPESVLYDADRDRLIVSNIDGHPGETDGKGYLSLLSRSGRVIERVWVDGLDAPKGMAIQDGRLFVADLEQLRIIDLDSGMRIASIRPRGAVFLNDIAAGTNGSVYISDMMTHRIYRYRDGSVDAWIEGPPLSHPNGVHARGDELIVGNWGEGLRDDFSTFAPGDLLAVSMRDGSITSVAGGDALGNIDGIEHLGTDLVVSDWINGALYAISADGNREEIKRLEPGIADIGSHAGVLYVPSMITGSVHAYDVGGAR